MNYKNNAQNDLGAWITDFTQHCQKMVAKSMSRTDLVHERPAFSYAVTPARGSVLASPISALWNPEPDYFFHWSRDSAIVMNSAIPLCSGADGEIWHARLEDYINFSHASLNIKGAEYSPNPLTSKTLESYKQYLHEDQDLAALSGDALMSQARINPDGTPDFLKWAKPQNDGPALRAITVMRYISACAEQGRMPPGAAQDLLDRDLDFVLRQAGKPCVGPWEEDSEFAHHYFTSAVQLGALEMGAHHLRCAGDNEKADKLKLAAEILECDMDQFWSDEHDVYKAIREKDISGPHDAFDAAILMGVIHAGRMKGAHSLDDPRLRSTIRHMQDYFSCAYSLNAGQDGPPVIGRSKSDRYFGGNPWFATSFALSEYYYAADDIESGDALLNKVRQYIPADGSLSEQFERSSGAPVSARHLTWSYSAFLDMSRARGEAMERKVMPQPVSSSEIRHSHDAYSGQPIQNQDPSVA